VFNSSDLVTVFVGGRYETQELAGWSDGDFNDDAIFNSSDLVVALDKGMYSSEAAVAESPASDPTVSIGGQVKLQYDNLTGDLSLVTGPERLSTLEIRSSDSLFQPEFAEGFDGLFDVKRSDKLFKMDVSGFGDWELGSVLPAGLVLDELRGDLSIDGSLADGGRLSGVLIEAVPEPNSVLLTAIGFAALVFSRTFRSQRNPQNRR
jgi:hypothetical protein